MSLQTAQAIFERLKKSDDLEDRVMAILVEPVVDKLDQLLCIQLRGRAKRIVKLFEEAEPV